jgi:DNA-directed RNA polymerase specialized sigma54-like protein
VWAQAANQNPQPPGGHNIIPYFALFFNKGKKMTLTLREIARRINVQATTLHRMLRDNHIYVPCCEIEMKHIEELKENLIEKKTNVALIKARKLEKIINEMRVDS